MYFVYYITRGGGEGRGGVIVAWIILVVQQYMGHALPVECRWWLNYQPLMGAK